MSNPLIVLASKVIARKIFLKWLRRQVSKLIPMTKYREYVCTQENPYHGTEFEWSFKGSSRYTMGILFDYSHQHSKFMKACHEMDVSYKVIDISVDNYIDVVREAEVDVFLVLPFVTNTVLKEMCDERVRTMVHDLGMFVYPSLDEIWIYESKRRVRDWLLVHNFPHPRTWVFYRESEALDFLNKSSLPIVSKIDLSSSATGITIIKSYRQGRALIKKAFSKGLVSKNRDERDNQWGHIIFQEYLPNVNEWRMVRVNKSYFCRFKDKKGDFHSGAGGAKWEKPPRELLDMARQVTEAGNFTSMDVDIFETEDGRFHINELHTMFGEIAERDLVHGTDNMGRYFYDEEKDEWDFEPGWFYQNACSNLRIEYVIELLDQKKSNEKI